MNKPNIAALERLHADATPEPWEWTKWALHNETDHVIWPDNSTGGGLDENDWAGLMGSFGRHAEGHAEANATLIAAARNALPALLALARAAWEVDNDLSQSLESHLAPDVYDLWRAALAAMDFEDAGGAP